MGHRVCNINPGPYEYIPELGFDPPLLTGHTPSRPSAVSLANVQNLQPNREPGQVSACSLRHSLHPFRHKLVRCTLRLTFHGSRWHSLWMPLGRIIFLYKHGGHPTSEVFGVWKLPQTGRPEGPPSTDLHPSRGGRQNEHPLPSSLPPPPMPKG